MNRTLSILAGTVLITAAAPAQNSWVPLGFEPFGGEVDVHRTSPHDVLVFTGTELWTYDAKTWQWGALGVSMPFAARTDAATAYDPVRNRFLVHGGHSATTGFLKDIWELDLNTLTWTSGPPSTWARAGASMVYDPQSGRVLAIGGEDGSGVHGAVEAWNGSNWSQLATMPVGLRDAAATLRGDTGEVYVFGGTAQSGPRKDTWSFDPFLSVWTNVPTATAPGDNLGGQGLAHAGMVFDELRNRLIVHGGESMGVYDDGTWEFDGSDWVMRAIAPWARTRHGLCYLPGVQATYAFAGFGAGGTAIYRNTQPADVEAFGTSCPVGGLAPELQVDGLPWLGTQVELSVQNQPAVAIELLVIGASDTLWNGVPLPFSLAAIGFPGCSLDVSADIVEYIPAGFSLSGPAASSFAGQSLYAQAIVLGAVPVGFDLGTSLAVRLQLGEL